MSPNTMETPAAPEWTGFSRRFAAELAARESAI
jgi:hypothetical protein